MIIRHQIAQQRQFGNQHHGIDEDSRCALPEYKTANSLLDNIPIYTTPLLSSNNYLSTNPVSHSSSSSLNEVNPPEISFTSSGIALANKAKLIGPLPAVSFEGLMRRASREQITNACNLTDADDLDEHVHLMDDYQKELWRIRNSKASPDYQKQYSKKYIEALNFAIPITADHAGKMTFCMHSKNGKPVPCKTWHLCDRCAVYEATQRYRQYSGIFTQEFRFFSVTLGYDGHLDFSSTSAENCRLYWKINKELIQSLNVNDVIQGAYLVHELKISSFLPLRANPHSHVLIVSTQPLEEVQDQIQEMAQQAKLPLTASIRIKEIGNTAQDHENVIRYLTKSIDLSPAYQTAWNGHCVNHQRRIPELNREVKECYDAIAVAFHRYKKVYCFGNLMPQTKGFIGKSKAEVVREAKAAKAKKVKRKK